MPRNQLRAVPLALLGAGAVGRAVLTQIVSTRRLHADRYEMRLCLTAIGDTSGHVVSRETELSDAEVAGLIGHKGAGRPLATHPAAQHTGFVDSLDLDQIAGGFAERPILVDTTAADTAPLLQRARRSGWRVVLANKLPLTGPLDVYRDITRGGHGARWEATVASALPVMATLLSIVERGDHVRWVTGALSGTMGYLVHRLEQRGRLSEVVAEAGTRGYLEPDPRADLSGLDAGRKALIVARALGYDLDLSDVSIEGLYPAEWDSLDIATFHRRLPEIDAVVSRRFDACRSAGTKMRYLGYIGDSSARAELAELMPGTPLLRPHATDSFVVIETDHFRTNPLVLSGRGSGPTVAAAGVLGDILSLARD